VLPLGAAAQIYFAGVLAVLVVGYAVGVLARRARFANRLLVIAWLLSVPAALVLLRGGVSLPWLGVTWVFAPELIAPSLYGGLMLTILLAVVGIAASFPLGVGLALGRRSRLPVIRGFCVAYIEFIRGVPLVSLLFMAMLALPLLLPPGRPAPSNVTRAMVAITLFSAAYLAETVRGGLQAVPKGQYDAADALGLGGWQKLRLIILPQALRAVIPAIVGQFISLLKDTSLVTLVGLTEFLGIARAVIQQPEWIQVAGGITREVYLFVGVVYFLFSFGMSYASRRLEARLGVGQR
jgi:general L-amino acid transport system permease protein